MGFVDTLTNAAKWVYDMAGDMVSAVRDRFVDTVEDIEDFAEHPIDETEKMWDDLVETVTDPRKFANAAIGVGVTVALGPAGIFPNTVRSLVHRIAAGEVGDKVADTVTGWIFPDDNPTRQEIAALPDSAINLHAQSNVSAYVLNGLDRLGMVSADDPKGEVSLLQINTFLESQDIPVIRGVEHFTPAHLAALHSALEEEGVDMDVQLFSALNEDILRREDNTRDISISATRPDPLNQATIHTGMQNKS